MAVSPEIEFTAVAAIDFGTARSGYGFAYTATPDEIHCPTDWAGGRGVDLKTLTNILLDRNTLKYKYFGYEAREEYFEESDDEEGKEGGSLFFETFKMSLYAEDGVQDYLTSACGIRLESHIVFREALAFMKDEVLKKINKADAGNTKVEARDIMWVITVPGMWRDKAKTIMRKAAEAAGMGTHHNLMLALEPEAASLHVRAEYKEIDQLPEGSKYIVVDCGGGTVDFACHKISKHGVHETHPACGGPWGSTYIDKGYVKLLCDIFSEDTIMKFKADNPTGWLQVMNDWEAAKLRMTDFDKPKRVPLPYSLIQTLGGESQIKLQCKTYTNVSRDQGLNQVIKFSEGLKLDGNTIKFLFTPMLDGITNQIRTLLQAEEVKDSKHLFVVGGFAASELIQTALTTTFPALKLVTPNRPNLSIIKGATMYGFKPSIILARKARFTYGVESCTGFSNDHDPSKLMIGPGFQLLVKEVFNAYVQVGQEVGYDEIVEHIFYPITKTQDQADFDFYTTTKEEPKYVTDDGCETVGKMIVKLPEFAEDDEETGIKCLMKFGGTEIDVTAITVKDGKETAITLDFLSE